MFDAMLNNLINSNKIYYFQNITLKNSKALNSLANNSCSMPLPHIVMAKNKLPPAIEVSCFYFHEQYEITHNQLILLNIIMSQIYEVAFIVSQ